MKIKIIDILNKISNGEEPPKRIIFREQEYEYDLDGEDYYYCNGAIYWLFDEYVITDILNEEVEILETTITMNKQDNMDNNIQVKIEKLEKIDMFDYFTGYSFDNTSVELLKHLEKNFSELNDKINEIIRYINANF